MSKQVTIQAYQNIVDVCLQEYGSLEFLYDLHRDSGLSDFPALLPAGTVLTVYPEKITGSRRAVALLQQQMPGTGYGMVEAPVQETLFRNGYLHAGDYLFPETVLLRAAEANP